jgi:hypothetical protein
MSHLPESDASRQDAASSPGSGMTTPKEMRETDREMKKATNQVAFAKPKEQQSVHRAAV